MDLDDPEELAQGQGPRKPRKIFLVVGLVLATALGIGLFTSVGNSPASNSSPHQGGPVPSFSAPRLNGGGTVSVGGSGTTGTVLLFFANSCGPCHAELPPLADAVHRQQRAGGPFSQIRVVGIDSGDRPADAKAFIKSSGVTFPVAYDPNLQIIEEDFNFDGDPYAVFVRPDGTISRIVPGATLDPSSLRSDEEALIPSGN